VAGPAASGDRPLNDLQQRILAATRERGNKQISATITNTRDGDRVGRRGWAGRWTA